MPLESFHPAVAQWFAGAFAAPTAAQAAAWPAIRDGCNVLVSAPTGSGKTLTAFLTAIDMLVREGLATPEGLPDATMVVYVSPLKALSNDVRLNLEAPLTGIRDQLAALGLADVPIRTAVRTGDTPQSERARMRRRPPHILVTTPESLYVMLGSDSGRAMLANARSVIVDEIHAVAGDKRGSHLALSLERLDALAGQRLVRIGLSATQKPIDTVARFLVGGGRDDARDCAVIEVDSDRPRDLALELPPTPLSAVLSGDQAQQMYRRVAQLAQLHRTTLVFVNTRRMAERAARHLGELLGREHVAAHHGSLSREARLDAEQRLKRGELQVLVATASLELGIDIGDVDLVCQIGSPRSVSAFLQRAGRSRHHVGGVPKARLFATTRDELVECAALLDCVRRGELDVLRIPDAPLDVLAQQIVAETGAQEWDEDALYALVRGAWPYRELARGDFDAVIRMLADGYVGRHGPRSAWVHRDAVHGRLRARRGARMVATMSGGTIPETGDYTVMLEPDGHGIGSVNEDFAVESLAGDVFQLGNTSYRILRVEAGRLRVEDAHGLPPNIPFWLGEAPGRTDVLSASVSRLRASLAQRLDDGPDAADGHAAAHAWLAGDLGLCAESSRQLVDYLAAARTALGVLPTQQCVVLERFFDASGGTQLVIHAPFGSRINRAWGLALRKRFCRSFNFELQAAATEDAIVLSLSTSHSFPLADVGRFLNSASALDVLVQALLDAPLFGVRWRWNATTALALPRFAGGRKVAPQLQRMRSEDLLAAVFPDQVACLENIVGEREIPDHPLVAQTLRDCLEEAMDAPGWLDVLRGIESGAITVVARDLTAPSPLAAEPCNARPYAFLDDAPLEERRTQAVQHRRYADATSADDLGRLDPAAIARVRDEAWPEAASADELHDALMTLGALDDAELERGPGWPALAAALQAAGRATRLALPAGGLHVATERLPLLRALHPDAPARPAVAVPAGFASVPDPELACVDLVRARLAGLGPVAAAALAAPLGLPVGDVERALFALEQEGTAMRGHFTGTVGEEWCERGLLARIHRDTLGRLRREIEPVAVADYVRFLCDWQRVTAATRARGPEALAGVLSQLEGFEAPATTWEAELLAARLGDYVTGWLDELCTAGRTTWLRLRPRAADGVARSGSLRTTPVVLLPRRETARWTRLAPAPVSSDALSSRALRLNDVLQRQGASFFDELQDDARLLRTELEDALAELVNAGLAHCDSFAGLRALLVPPSRRPSKPRRGRCIDMGGIADAGRWGPARRDDAAADADDIEHVARVLLRRYGVVGWRMLEREPDWLPPWRDLVRVYRRLEARGEIRGGRFVAGLSGEQYALPDAVGLLRAVRNRPHDGELVCISAHDPLNLAGTVLPGARVPRQPGARLVLRDGQVVATRVGDSVEIDAALDATASIAARAALLREAAPRRVALGVPAN